MRIITDFHLHSRFSRACSQDLTIPNIALACERKGIQFVGTADALHPKWREELNEELQESEGGSFELRNNASPTRFLLSTEVSCIYKRGGKVRRVHHILLFPSFHALDRVRDALLDRGFNLKSDGRPIMGLDSEELMKIMLDADPKNMLIPAHAWTPWFSVFGSKSGFDSLEECFGEMTSHVFAIETGLSSDPEMNWRWSKLDSLFFVSNSDAHSCGNLGREANVFDLDIPSYDALYQIFSTHDQKRFLETIEFFPEEGKYFADGHRSCDFYCEPEETKRLDGKCPKCGRALTVGVLSRIADIADRPPRPKRPPSAVPFRSIVPLAEVIAVTLGVGKTSKKVKIAYDLLVSEGRTEFGVLLDLSASELQRITTSEICEMIMRVRNGEMKWSPGYDGEYGKILSA